MSGNDARIRDLERQSGAAVTLRLAGASFDEIAETLSLTSSAHARDLVITNLSARASTEVRDTLRVEESARLERLLRGVWPKATNPGDAEHLPAAKVALGIIDRHIRLNGLDAPTEVLVHNPTVAEIDAWVAIVTAERTAPLRQLAADVTAIDTDETDEPEIAS